jgi:hypothetical protein
MNPVLINSIGLVFDIVGAIMIWMYIPALFEEGKNGDVMPTDIGENKRKLTRSRVGIILIAIAFSLQFISSIMQLPK